MHSAVAGLRSVSGAAGLLAAATQTAPGEPQVRSYICLRAVYGRCVLAFSCLVVQIHKEPQDNGRSLHISVYILETVDGCLLCLPCHTGFHVGSRSVGGDLCGPWTQTLYGC